MVCRMAAPYSKYSFAQKVSFGSLQVTKNRIVPLHILIAISLIRFIRVRKKQLHRLYQNICPQRPWWGGSPTFYA